MFETIKSQVAEMEQKRKELAKSVQGSFAADIKPMFDAHPALKGFSWRQYTPHFNDGDTCEFGAHTEELDFWLGDNELDPEDPSEPTHDYFGEYSLGRHEKDMKPEDVAACRAVFRAMENLPEEILKDVFGDHARVYVTPSGAHVEEYDHD